MARQNLGVFQHHDGMWDNFSHKVEAFCRSLFLIQGSLLSASTGITGTAKDHVVVDYGKRMLSGLQASERIMATAIQNVLAPDDTGLEVRFVLCWVFFL